MDLEQILKDDCLKNNLSLFEDLEQIKTDVSSIWRTPRLPQFPDHGINHSERIIEKLGQLLIHLQNTDFRLTSEEMYILLASCYLHDIGMQDLIVPNKSFEEFGIEDYELIRKRHPRSSYDLILQSNYHQETDKFPLHLQNDSFLSVIAWVSKGHGTDYFDETITELRENKHFPGGHKIRGELLTSLLLIADELDLHRDRARFPIEMKFLPLAQLHLYIHHYINGVEIVKGETNKERKVILTLCYPEDSYNYKNLIIEWITNKLQRQIRKTQEIIRTQTDGELILSPRIEVREFFDTDKVQRPMPIEIQNLLSRELIKFQVVNYDEILDKIQNNLENMVEMKIISLVSEYEEALVQVIKFIESICSSLPKKIILIDFRNEPFSYEDFIGYLIDNLLISQPDYKLKSELLVGTNIREEEKSLPLIKRFSLLIEDFNKYDPNLSFVLVIQNFNLINKTLKEIIFNQILPCFNNYSIKISVILTSNHLLSPSKEIMDLWELFILGKIDIPNIALQLKKRGYNNNESEIIAKDIFETSIGGQPKGVIYKVRQIDQYLLS